MDWSNAEQIELALEQTFNAILQTRMQDIPIVNPALTVEALGFARINTDWLGILITPWFMNLVLLPTAASDWLTYPPGNKFTQTFSYGVFEFTVANEAKLGRYALCSLFSPMFQFQNQNDARNAALGALQALSAPPKLSRRNLLLGDIGKR